MSSVTFLSQTFNHPTSIKAQRTAGCTAIALALIYAIFKLTSKYFVKIDSSNSTPLDKPSTPLDKAKVNQQTKENSAIVIEYLFLSSFNKLSLAHREQILRRMFHLFYSMHSNSDQTKDKTPCFVALKDPSSPRSTAELLSRGSTPDKRERTIDLSFLKRGDLSESSTLNPTKGFHEDIHNARTRTLKSLRGAQKISRLTVEQIEPIAFTLLQDSKFIDDNEDTLISGLESYRMPADNIAALVELVNLKALIYFQKLSSDLVEEIKEKYQRKGEDKLASTLLFLEFERTRAETLYKREINQQASLIYSLEDRIFRLRQAILVLNEHNTYLESL
ncbi:hypothetical protein AB751O23_AA_00180 [Chlamydiales bacterium SCGC AB-751-O23]|jgi:hypothetical protein|nr:hypothetical protein AB751O23_AA_00180 [Chlamydiales bacterium SCGC AB-751-O23]